MSDTKTKILEIIGKQTLCGLSTTTEDGKPWVRYAMGVASDDLTIRFCTFLGSRKVAQIRNNPEVHVTAGVSSPETAQHYVQVQGRAEVTRDEAERKAFWHEQLKAYFQGPDDPNYCIIIIKPYRIEYQTMGSMEPEVWEA